MVKVFAAYLDFVYLARSETFTETTVFQLEDAVSRFHSYRHIFQLTGVRDPSPKGLSLPRQHAMTHYAHLIMEFGSPNGLCSSITENAHIRCVKQPWRRTNRWRSLKQMLTINQRLDKLAAAAVDFASRGMLVGTPLQAAHLPPSEAEIDEDEDEDEGGPVEGPVLNHVVLAKKKGVLYFIFTSFNI